MTNEERFVYFESGQLQRAVEIELLDWAGYWSSVGVDGITDEDLRERTRSAVIRVLSDLPVMIKKVSRLVISMDSIKSAEADNVTNEMIKTAVTQIMSSRLEWL